jgi:hypothetical protein
MRRRYQVFVSSTFSDLHEERQTAIWEILKLRHIPAGMESFPATDDRGWKIIQRTIDDSDFYVLLIAGRYGSIDSSTGNSWTEREYEYARSKGIPVLAFVRDQASITANKMDTDAAEKLAAFILKINTNHLCSTWKTADDLALRIVQALSRAIQDAEDDGIPRPGWVRGGAALHNALRGLTQETKAEELYLALKGAVGVIAEKRSLAWSKTVTLEGVGTLFYFGAPKGASRLYDILALSEEGLNHIGNVWRAEADFLSLLEALMFSQEDFDESAKTVQSEQRLERVLATIGIVGLAALSDVVGNGTKRTRTVNPRNGRRFVRVSMTWNESTFSVDLQQASLDAILPMTPLERNGKAYQMFVEQLQSQGLILNQSELELGGLDGRVIAAPEGTATQQSIEPDGSASSGSVGRVPAGQGYADSK